MGYTDTLSGLGQRDSAADYVRIDPNRYATHQKAVTLPSLTYWHIVPEAIFSRDWQCITIADIAPNFYIKDLAQQWKNETGHFSVIQQSISHPAYLEIAAMRDKALPFLMEQVELGSAQWLPALRAIAGPTRPDEGDSLEEAFNAWKQWWIEKQNWYAGVDFAR